MLSDKWLSKYGLLENFNAKILSLGYLLDFDLYPAWTLGSDVVEWKLILQGIYGASMNAFWHSVMGTERHRTGTRLSVVTTIIIEVQSS